MPFSLDPCSYAADRRDHRLGIPGKALYPLAGDVLPCVKSVRDDRRLNYVLRSVREVEDEQRYDEEHEALLERKVHDERCNAIYKTESEPCLARAEF